MCTVHGRFSAQPAVRVLLIVVVVVIVVIIIIVIHPCAKPQAQLQLQLQAPTWAQAQRACSRVDVPARMLVATGLI